MLLRIAVRTIESWLLADRERIAEFLSIDSSLVPLNPEADPSPKRTLVDLARRSRNSKVRRDLVPRPGSGREEGSLYTYRIAEYVELLWDPEAAAQRSDSLRRCRERLRELVPPD